MPDRRVRRTHRRLKEALLDLMKEKGYGRITVQELVDRADVARSTFYAHFDDKDDLLFDGFDRWLLDLARVPGVDEPTAGGPDGPVAGDTDAPPAERRFRFSLPLLRHAGGHRRVFRAIFGSTGSPRAARRFHDLLVQVVLRELPEPDWGSGPRDPPEDRIRDARAHAVAGAFMAVLTWWFESGAGLPPERVDQAFHQAVAGAASGPG